VGSPCSRPSIMANLLGRHKSIRRIRFSTPSEEEFPEELIEK